MGFIRGRYSWLLRPALVVYDLLVINLWATYFLTIQTSQGLRDTPSGENNFFVFHIYITICWFLSAQFIRFYEVYRYTTWLDLFSLLIKQFLVFAFTVYAFVGFFPSTSISTLAVASYLLYISISVSTLKLLSYYGLKLMRRFLKGNLRHVIVVGSGESARALKNMFLNQKTLGYKLKGVFNNSTDPEVSGSIQDSFHYLNNRSEIDEIYCAIDELTDKEINEYIRIANENKCNIKFIPNTKKLATKRLKTEYYQYTPVLSLEEIRLNKIDNQWLKRSFDIVFSLFIIVFVLSWLSVILFILIKLESRGPLFYSHQRTGINYKVFTCYKYRSMHITEEIDGTYVIPNDKRVTAIGKVLRSTSLDELPQFINVLIGDMSVVGPRPHMLSYTEAYAKKINKYNFMFRHHVKPGITGLAQTRGYRGEIESDQDIIGRVKYDIFYIENWSLLLDIKIIFQTFLNIIKGEEKAY